MRDANWRAQAVVVSQSVVGVLIFTPCDKVASIHFTVAIEIAWQANEADGDGAVRARSIIHCVAGRTLEGARQRAGIVNNCPWSAGTRADYRQQITNAERSKSPTISNGSIVPAENCVVNVEPACIVTVLPIVPVPPRIPPALTVTPPVADELLPLTNKVPPPTVVGPV